MPFYIVIPKANNFVIFICIISGYKIICFGDSNTKRHRDELFEILPETKLFICYYLEEIVEKMPVIQEDYYVTCIIHILTNDVKNVCQKAWSDDDKKMKLYEIYITGTGKHTKELVFKRIPENT